MTNKITSSRTRIYNILSLLQLLNYERVSTLRNEKGRKRVILLKNLLPYNLIIRIDLNISLISVKGF